MEQLKPCPFCGGEVEFRNSHVVGEGGHVQHTDIGYMCPITLGALSIENDSFIVETWNRRASHAKLVSALKGLLARHNDGSEEGPWAEWDTAREALRKAGEER